MDFHAEWNDRFYDSKRPTLNLLVLLTKRLDEHNDERIASEIPYDLKE